MAKASKKKAVTKSKPKKRANKYEEKLKVNATFDELAKALITPKKGQVMEDIENTGRWVSEYFAGYVNYMTKYHLELYNKFVQNIHPPQYIGGGVMIGRSARNTDEDYDEIFKISKEFCNKYPNPIDFPKHF